MIQYRLLDNTVDVIEATDEFWDASVRKWKVVPRDIIGERFYAVIPYRRAIPEPEPVKQEPTIDPGEGWRLVRDDEPLLPTDEREYANSYTDEWDIPTGNDMMRRIKAGATTAELRAEALAWSDLVFRRRATKKIVLKEYLERYGEHYRTEWHNGNVENCKGAGFIMPDESWPTGQEREIEVPV